LGGKAWNAGTFWGAYPGQAGMLMDRMRDGQRLRVIVGMMTDTGHTFPFDRVKTQTRDFYVGPGALRLFRRHENLNWRESLEWTWALLSPSFRAGKSLENEALAFLGEKSPKAMGDRWKKRREKNASILQAYRKDQGQTRGTEARVWKHDTNWYHQRYLDNGRYRWRVHPMVHNWVEALAREAQKHGVHYFHVMTPRRPDQIRHKRYRKAFAEPIENWARQIEKRHPNFHLVPLDLLTVGVNDYYNTTEHFRAEKADALTATLAEYIDGILYDR
jgi:hypothetical protein